MQIIHGENTPSIPKTARPQEGSTNLALEFISSGAQHSLRPRSASMKIDKLLAVSVLLAASGALAQPTTRPAPGMVRPVDRLGRPTPLPGPVRPGHHRPPPSASVRPSPAAVWPPPTPAAVSLSARLSLSPLARRLDPSAHPARVALLVQRLRRLWLAASAPRLSLDPLWSRSAASE